MPQAHKDAIYGLAFSPDGNMLATAGYDRLIRLWDLSASPPRRRSAPSRTTATPSTRSRSTPTGNLLASASADRAVKVWDAATGNRLYTLERPDRLGVRGRLEPGRPAPRGRGRGPQRPRLGGGPRRRPARAVGVAHDKAVLRVAFTADGKTLFSAGEDRAVKSWDALTLKETAVLPARPESVLSFALRPDGRQVAVGRFDGVAELLDAATGRPLKAVATPKPAPASATDRFPAVAEAAGPTDSARTAMPVALPVTIAGALDRAGDVDFFRFEAAAGQQVGQCRRLRPGSSRCSSSRTKPAACWARGRPPSATPSERAGTYAVGIRDRDFRGGKGLTYRLHVGPIPVVTGVFPLGVTRGRTTEVRIDGVNLGGPARRHGDGPGRRAAAARASRCRCRRSPAARPARHALRRGR